MAKRILTVGILGQGRSGYDIHARWLRQAPKQYKITAVSDELPERRADAARELGARTYKDYRELLRKEKDLDLIVNALPSTGHPAGTIEALNLGHNVVCEKPLATKVADLDRMIAAAKKNRRLLAPFQNSRFAPYFTKTREVIASGVLGEILYIRSNWSGFSRRWDWQTLQKNWGGSLNNTGPHPMDQAVMLFGEGKKMPNVFAKMISGPGSLGDADDLDVIILHGKGSPTIEVVLNSYQAFPQGDLINVSGSLGGLAAGQNGVTWKYYDPKKASRQKLHKKWSVNRQYVSEKIPWTEKFWKLPKQYLEMGFPYMSMLFYNNIHDVLTGKGKLIVTPQQVRTQVAVIEECHRQNRLPKKK
ncbi:MAG: Gfo/Idh/MocA family oxidoreductase [Phycisphaerae bacterium]|nr:Gfo/Idh/MocA family oxidoreductase [Phycisphaerae bacterium]